MNATQYMVHWKTKEVWNNLLSVKHQVRLKRCAGMATLIGHAAADSVIDVGCAYGHSTDHMARFQPSPTWFGFPLRADSSSSSSTWRK